METWRDHPDPLFPRQGPDRRGSGAGPEDSRSGNDDLSVDELLVESGVLAFLVRGGDESVTLVLEPLANAKLVLSCSEQLRNLESVTIMVVSLVPKPNLWQHTSHFLGHIDDGSF